MRTFVAGRMVVAFLCGTLLAGCSAGSNRKSIPDTVPAGETEAQERYLRALIRTEPKHWRARIRLANLAGAAGRPTEAFEVLREAARQSPRNLVLQTTIAEIAEQSDYLDWRLYSLLKAARQSPRDVALRLKLASLYRRMGWQRDAAAQLAVAASLDPGAQPVLMEQAAFYSRQGQPDDTRRCAEQLIARYPKSPHGYSLRADLAAQSGRWKEAVDYGNRAMERAPGDVTFQLRQAQYQLTRTDSPQPEAALIILDTATGADPQNAQIHYWRGITLRRLGRTQEALGLLE